MTQPASAKKTFNMENNYGPLEVPIRPNEVPGIINIEDWKCPCEYKDFCRCFPEDPCSCFDTPKDDAKVPKKSDATKQHLDILEYPGVGRYRIERTSSLNNLCGMFALEISTEDQIGIELEPKTFSDIWCSPEMQAFNRQNGYKNSNNFHDEQLARVLQICGRRLKFDKFQLGVIVEGSAAFILGKDDKTVLVFSEADMESESGFLTVWIHNNNAVELKGAEINHYSGVTIVEESEETSAEEGNATEVGASDAEAGQGAEDEKHDRGLKRKASEITDE